MSNDLDKEKIMDWKPFGEDMLKKPDADPVHLMKESVKESIQDIHDILDQIDASHVVQRIHFNLMFTGGQACGDDDPVLEICAFQEPGLGAIASIGLRDWLNQIIPPQEDCTVDEEIKALEDIRKIIDEAIESRKNHEGKSP